MPRKPLTERQAKARCKKKNGIWYAGFNDRCSPEALEAQSKAYARKGYIWVMVISGKRLFLWEEPYDLGPHAKILGCYGSKSERVA